MIERDITYYKKNLYIDNFGEDIILGSIYIIISCSFKINKIENNY